MSPTVLAPTRFERIVGRNTRTVEGRRAIALARVQALTIDECVARHSAFSTLLELVDTRLTSGYRPSLYTTPRGTSVYRFELAFLAQRIADAYDAAMADLGDARRAYRGH